MPHFHIDYSANLEDVVDMGTLCEVIRAEAALTDTFPLAGIRVRATRVDHFAMADGHPRHGYVDLTIRLREGRADTVKHDALARIYAAMENFVAPALETHSIALSAEIREISAAFSAKSGNIRDHLETGA